MATAGVDSNVQKTSIKSGPTGRNPHITPKGKIHAGTNCGSIHRGDAW
jgi:hypothetical protein